MFAARSTKAKPNCSQKAETDIYPDSITSKQETLGLAKPHQVTFHQVNDEIYGQGDPVNSIYQVEYGAIRLYALLSDGRRQICAFYVAGEVFGFELGEHHRFFAEALSETAVRVFRPAMEDDNASLMLPLAISALVQTQEHLLVIGRQTAKERVARFLVNLHERLGEPAQMELVMSRADIADYLGLTIETVSRVLSSFRRSDLMKLHGTRSVEFQNITALRALCA